MKSDRIMGPTFNRRETLGLPLGAERELVGGGGREREGQEQEGARLLARLPA